MQRCFGVGQTVVEVDAGVEVCPNAGWPNADWPNAGWPKDGLPNAEVVDPAVARAPKAEGVLVLVE